MKKIFLLFFIHAIILICINPNNLFAQQHKVDSLQNILKTAKEDTSKLNTLFLLVENTGNYNEKIIYNKDAEHLAQILFQSKNAETRIKGETGIAKAFINNADNYMHEENLQKAIESRYAALEVFKSLDDKISIATSYNEIGVIYTILGDYVEALRCQSIALKINQEIKNENGILTVNNSIARIYYSQGNYAESLQKFLTSLKTRKQLLEKAQQTGNIEEVKQAKRRIGDSYYDLSYIYRSQTNYDKALDFELSRLRIYQELADQEEINSSYLRAGDIYNEKQDSANALKYYSYYLKACEKAGDKSGISAAYERFGYFYLNKKEYDKALAFQIDSKKISEEIGDENGNATSYNDIADVYFKKGKLNKENYNQALDFYFKALKIYEKMEFAYARGVYYDIGKTYFEQNRIKEAKQNFLNSLKFYHEFHNLDGLEQNYFSLSKCDSALGNYKAAYEYYKLYSSYNDTINEEKNNHKVTQVQFNYEAGEIENDLKIEQQKKDTIATQEIVRQRNIRNSSFAGLAVVLLFSFYVVRQRNKVKQEKTRSDELLLNILPSEVAEELKNTGAAKAKAYTMVTVMFTDFRHFTTISEKVSAELLVDEIHYCFSGFDNIIQKYKIEKIKTIGDAYLCASGLPVSNYTHAVDMINAAFEIQSFMLQRKKEKEARGEIPFELRIGIHTGSVVAGIVGVKKYAYDIWGDTVNIAARMEQNSDTGKINISGSTYELVKDKCACEYRGKIEAKHKGEIDMYFAEKFP